MSPPNSLHPQKQDFSPAMVLIVTTLGGFLVTFMLSAVNVALPLIEEEFHVSAVMLSWISLIYILVAGAILLPVGRISDVYGRVRFMFYGAAVFAVISFACAFAPSARALLVLRGVHGFGFAMGMVTSTSLVVLAYPPALRGRAIGLSVAGIYLGLTAGPVLGGIIIHNLGWRGLFLVGGALGLLQLILAVWKMRHLEWREPKTGRFDLVGSLAYAVGLVILLLGFSLLPGLIGSILIVAGIVALAGFLWWEGRAEDPLLRVDLMRHNRVFAFSNAAALINYAATYAMVFLMSLYLQYNRGLDAQLAGFVLVTGTFVQAVLSPFVGRLADRVQARYIATVGMALCVVGLLALSFVDVDTSYWYIIGVLCLLGVGFALFASPITHALMSSVEQRDLGVASATLGAMRTVGQNLSMGIATLVLALLVGREAIQPEDYPQVLSSVRISFLIFAVLCVFGVAASMVGPKRSR